MYPSLDIPRRVLNATWPYVPIRVLNSIEPPDLGKRISNAIEPNIDN